MATAAKPKFGEGLESAAGTTSKEFDRFCDAKGPFALLVPDSVRVATQEELLRVSFKIRPEQPNDRQSDSDQEQYHDDEDDDDDDCKPESFEPLTLSLKQLYSALQCRYVELVTPLHGLFIVLCDEDGAHRPPNYLCQNLLMDTGIFGPMVVCKSGLFQ